MRFEFEMDLEDLPIDMADQCHHSTLLKFVTELDEQVCERSFTEELIRRLQAALEESDS
jgi:hypothetical protein